MASDDKKQAADSAAGDFGDAAVSAWEAARRYGIDMSLIEANLRKTPAQRLRDHQSALNLALALREAMGRHGG